MRQSAVATVGLAAALAISGCGQERHVERAGAGTRPSGTQPSTSTAETGKLTGDVHERRCGGFDVYRELEKMRAVGWSANVASVGAQGASRKVTTSDGGPTVLTSFSLDVDEVLFGSARTSVDVLGGQASGHQTVGFRFPGFVEGERVLVVVGTTFVGTVVQEAFPVEGDRFFVDATCWLVPDQASGSTRTLALPALAPDWSPVEVRGAWMPVEPLRHRR